MKKYYIVTNEAFLNQVKRDKEIKKNRSQFIKKFYEENEISGTGCYFSGNGFVNMPFEEKNKDSICLYIPDNPDNREKYGKQFKAGRIEGVAQLKKNSNLLKRFQSACIESGVVVNLRETMVSDYFKELYEGYTVQRFQLDGKMYMHISTDAYCNQEIIPNTDGFSEIKASEYYSALEKLEECEK